MRVGGVAHLGRDIIYGRGEFIRGSDAHRLAEIALGWNRAEGDPPVVKVHQRAAPDLGHGRNGSSITRAL